LQSNSLGKRSGQAYIHFVEKMAKKFRSFAEAEDVLRLELICSPALAVSAAKKHLQ
jgi:hypothetical protein